MIDPTYLSRRLEAFRAEDRKHNAERGRELEIVLSQPRITRLQQRRVTAGAVLAGVAGLGVGLALPAAATAILAVGFLIAAVTMRRYVRSTFPGATIRR